MNAEKINEVFSSKDYEVNVITTTDGEHNNGQVATWVTQVSADPPLLAVCMAPSRYTYELVNKSKVLAVNILSKGQASLVSHFGYQSGREVDKFKNVPFKKGVTGSPVIEGVSAYLECEVRADYDGGDHRILLSEVVNGEVVKPGPRISYQWLISKTEEA